jgi:hypothetical protein
MPSIVPIIREPLVSKYPPNVPNCLNQRGQSVELFGDRHRGKSIAIDRIAVTLLDVERQERQSSIGGLEIDQLHWGRKFRAEMAHGRVDDLALEPVLSGILLACIPGDLVSNCGV